MQAYRVVWSLQCPEWGEPGASTVSSSVGSGRDDRDHLAVESSRPPGIMARTQFLGSLPSGVSTTWPKCSCLGRGPRNLVSRSLVAELGVSQ